MANEEKILEMLGTINDRIGKMEATQARMEATQAQMEATQAQMEATQAQMEAAQTQMQEDITRINVTLEAKIAKDIQHLADGHMGIIEQLHKLDDIEKKLEEVSIRADAAHATAMENTRDITQLKRAR